MGHSRVAPLDCPAAVSIDYIAAVSSFLSVTEDAEIHLACQDRDGKKTHDRHTEQTQNPNVRVHQQGYDLQSKKPSIDALRVKVKSIVQEHHAKTERQVGHRHEHFLDAFEPQRVLQSSFLDANEQLDVEDIKC